MAQEVTEGHSCHFLSDRSELWLFEILSSEAEVEAKDEAEVKTEARYS